MPGEQPDIDRRFNPIYQRGGPTTETRSNDGDAAPAGISGSASSGEARDQAPDGAEPSRAAQHVPHAPESPDNSGSSGNSESHGAGRIAEVIPAGAVSAPARRGRGIPNPFLVGLWLLGAGLVGFGLWAVFAPLQMEDASMMGGPYPQWIFFVAQSASGIIVAGVIALCTAAALHAAFWERRHR